MSFILSERIVQILYDELHDGFKWRYSPQGFQYWHDVAKEIESWGQPLNISMSSAPQLPAWPPAPGTCGSILNNMVFAFSWDDSPQGKDYWIGVRAELCKVKDCEESGVIARESNSYADDYDRAMRGI